MKPCIVFAIALVLAIWLPEPAFPHGHYSWIMDNPDTASCCGERDCRAVDGGAVRYLDPGRWFVQGQEVPAGRTFQSSDNAFHACYFDPGRWLEPRCLFVPGVS